jgi:hypothetical protein
MRFLPPPRHRDLARGATAPVDMVFAARALAQRANENVACQSETAQNIAAHAAVVDMVVRRRVGVRRRPKWPNNRRSASRCPAHRPSSIPI